MFYFVCIVSLVIYLAWSFFFCGLIGIVLPLDLDCYGLCRVEMLLVVAALWCSVFLWNCTVVSCCVGSVHCAYCLEFNDNLFCLAYLCECTFG